MTEANQKAQDVIAKYGLYAAYAWLHNRIIYEKNNWPSAIDLEKIAEDQQVLDELAHRIAKDALRKNGWDFSKHDEGGPEDWEFDPFGTYADKKHCVEQVAASMALSGFVLTEDDKGRIEDLFDNPDSVEVVVKQLIEKHKGKDQEYE